MEYSGDHWKFCTSQGMSARMSSIENHCLAIAASALGKEPCRTAANQNVEELITSLAALASLQGLEALVNQMLQRSCAQVASPYRARPLPYKRRSLEHSAQTGNDE